MYEVVIVTEFYNPYKVMEEKRYSWLMTNFHIHNTKTQSDGSEIESKKGLSELFKCYKNAGYDVVMFSSQQSWYDTAEEGRAVGIKSINGQEYLEYDGILLVGTNRFIIGMPQESIDECIKDSGFAILCHPNLATESAMSHKQLEELKGAIGVEIYNGCLSRKTINGVSLGAGLAVDFWDKVLTSGKVLWGFGNDDSHEPYEIHVGWTEIYTASDSFCDIKSAVKRGSLCASRGLRLEDFRLEDNELSVMARYTYQKSDRIEYCFIGEGGKVLKRDSGSFGRYIIDGNEKYIRVEAISPDGSMLWTQPILNKNYYNVMHEEK